MKVFFLISFFWGVFSNNANSSVYEPQVLWQKAAIKYCYVDHNKQIKKTSFNRKTYDYALAKLPSSYRQNLDQIVREQFNPRDTITHFVGGKNCSEEPASDIYIIPVEPILGESKKPRIPYGKASVGYFGKVVYENMFKREFKTKKSHEKHYVLLNMKPVQYNHATSLFFEEALPYVLLHELGHILSFRHEHGREEMKEDPNCALNKAKQESISDTAITDGDYDPYSIMNYCYLHAIIKKLIPQAPPELSERDKELFRSLYAPLF